MDFRFYSYPLHRPVVVTDQCSDEILFTYRAKGSGGVRLGLGFYRTSTDRNWFEDATVTDRDGEPLEIEETRILRWVRACDVVEAAEV